MPKSLPNILTVLRMLLIPVFIFVYFSSSSNAHYYALIIFIIAGFTDYLDGTIARKYNLITPIGTVLDPLADKLMLLTAITCLWLDALLPLWVLAIVFVKEVTMIAGGIYFYCRKEKHIIPANKYGKIATAAFFLAIITILFAPEVKSLQYLAFAAVALKLMAFTSYVTFQIKFQKQKEAK